MDFQQIKYFLALAQDLHFWNTAKKVHITQSALSRHIQSLENELGFRLFERNKRNVRLTPAGSFLKEKWEVELSEMEFIHRFARQIDLGESGTIRIAHPDSISASLMPEILANIAATYPKLRIELVQILYENQHEFLNNYKIDLLITRDEHLIKGISSKKIHTDNLALVVKDNHPYQSIKDLKKDKLSEEKFILPVNDADSSYSDIIRKMFDYFDIIPDIYLNCEFGSAIIALVKKGFGIGVLPDSYIFHESRGVRFITLPFKSGLFLKWRTEDHNPILSNVLKLMP